MSRTRLSQLEQIEGTITYNDQLAQPLAEAQPGFQIGETTQVVMFTSNSVYVSGNYFEAGANPGDSITITGGSRNLGTFEITAITHNANLDTTQITVSSLLQEGSGSGNATLTINPNKTLEADMNHIRTQLRKLNDVKNRSAPHWYSEPSGSAVLVHATQFEQGTIPAGNSVDTGASFAAGNPFDLSVHLNGTLLKPSVISNGSIADQADYQEVDAFDQLVSVGQVGRKIQLNFDLVSGDILQFFWSK